MTSFHEQAPQGDPREDGSIIRRYRAKSFFVRKLFDGATPATEEGQLMVRNIVQIGDNGAEMVRQDSSLHSTLERFVRSSQPPDRFVFQKYSADFTNALLQETESLDIVDLVLAARATDRIMFSIGGENPS